VPFVTFTDKGVVVPWQTVIPAPVTLAVGSGTISTKAFVVTAATHPLPEELTITR
jgi:hypothetical protein